MIFVAFYLKWFSLLQLCVVHSFFDIDFGEPPWLWVHWEHTKNPVFSVSISIVILPIQRDDGSQPLIQLQIQNSKFDRDWIFQSFESYMISMFQPK